MILVALMPILILVSIVIAILRFNSPNVKTSKTKLSSRVSIRLLMVYVVVLLVATVWTWAFPVSSESVTALTSKEVKEKKQDYRLLTAGNAEEIDDSVIEEWSQLINEGVFKITSKSSEQMPMNLVIKRTDDNESVVKASLYQSMVLYNQYEIQTNLDLVNIGWQNDTLEIGNQSPPETNLNLKFYDYAPINRKFQREYNYGEFSEYLPVLYVEVPKSIKLYVDQKLVTNIIN